MFRIAMPGLGALLILFVAREASLADPISAHRTKVEARVVPLGPAPRDISSKKIVVSPDSGRLAFIRLKQGKATGFVDGQPSAPYDDIGQGSLTFSPDGRRVGYTALRDGQWYSVVDDVEGKPHKADGAANLVFSPSGAHEVIE